MSDSTVTVRLPDGFGEVAELVNAGADGVVCAAFTFNEDEGVRGEVAVKAGSGFIIELLQTLVKMLNEDDRPIAVEAVLDAAGYS